MNRTREYLRVYASGRWGVRRVRVSECRVIRAESLYDRMLREGRAPKPGEHGEVFVNGGCRVSWESVENRIWAFGRLFLRCGRCGKRATRLYAPTPTSEPECRECWGLTYATRTLGNYKPFGGGLLRAFGLTPRDWTMMDTADRRSEARRKARARYAERSATQRRAI